MTGSRMALSSSTMAALASSGGHSRAATSGLGAFRVGAFFLKGRTFPIFSPLKVGGPAGTGRPVFFQATEQERRSLGEG